jgi:uncharacterized protein
VDGKWETGEQFKVVNAPYFMASESGNKLTEAEPNKIAVIWSVDKDGGVIASMRSVGDVDCSAIAKMFNGGGHKNAAGCKFGTIGEFLEQFY